MVAVISVDVCPFLISVDVYDPLLPEYILLVI